MRLLALTLVLAACSSPEPNAPAAPDPAGPADSGLSPRQTADLAALGVPVLVADGYDLVSVTADRMETGGPAVVDYVLLYRRDGACVEVRGTNDGMGGPGLPAETRAVRLARVPGTPTMAIHRANTPDEAEMWGDGTVISEWLHVGENLHVSVRSADDLGDGCRLASLDAVARLAATLHPVRADGASAAPRPPTPPAPADLTDLGTFAPAPTVMSDPAIQSGDSPEDASRGLAERYDGEAQSVQVQIVQSVGRDATVLVTAEGLGDDSVAGERYRLLYRQGADGDWELEDAGVQVRCHAGRGHAGWSAAPCR